MSAGKKEKKLTGSSAEEKREERFKKWISPPGIDFISKEANENYQRKVIRIIKAIKLEEGDRVPCQIPAGNFPAYYAGYNLKTVMYDIEAMRKAWMKFVTDIDSDTHGYCVFQSGKVLDLLKYLSYKWPGHGLDDDAVSFQYDEKEYMKADEYDALINNPADYITRYFLPRHWGAFAPVARINSISYFFGIAFNFLSIAASPDFREMMETFIQASQELNKWSMVVGECYKASQEMGYPSTEGSFALSPYDTIADLLRGTHGISIDMYRQPDNLLEAMEKLVPITLQSVMESAEKARDPIVFIPMHKGDDNFMSDKQFEKFYWPPFRKLLISIINEGLVPYMAVDGSYNRRLECIKDLPRASVIWVFEKTDMAAAKKILGGHACIGGNVNGSLLYTGTPDDVEKYCRWLIDACAPGGGYILSLGITVDKVNPDNIKAIVNTAKKYGIYK